MRFNVDDLNHITHHRSPLCVPTTTPSVVRRSTPARYVDPSSPTFRAQPGPHCSLRLVEEKADVDFGSRCVTRGADTSVRLQGKLYVRGDSKIFRFQNGKTESLFLQRKNPRRIAWTTLYRRQHKKGISEVSKISFQESYWIQDRRCRITDRETTMTTSIASIHDLSLSSTTLLNIPAPPYKS